MKQPDEIGGAETQSCYFVVARRGRPPCQGEGGRAEIVLAVEDDDFGGRGYTCRDPEGHIWTFGTYDPWQGKFPVPAAPAPAAPSGAGGASCWRASRRWRWWRWGWRRGSAAR